MEKTYIGQRAHSAIQYQKASFNTYYFCPFSQSGHLKPSSFTKPDGWRGGEEARGVRKALLLRMCVYVEGVTVTQMGKFIYDRNTRVQKQLPRPCVRLAKNNFFVLLPPTPPERQLNV